jgi:hypothetical protein
MPLAMKRQTQSFLAPFFKREQNLLLSYEKEAKRLLFLALL